MTRFDPYKKSTIRKERALLEHKFTTWRRASLTGTAIVSIVEQAPPCAKRSKTSALEWAGLCLHHMDNVEVRFHSRQRKIIALTAANIIVQQHKPAGVQ